MYKLSVKNHIDAAHYLKGYLGKCANLHGHRWIIEIIVSGKRLNQLGMLIDFLDVKQAFKDKIESRFDHKCFNEIYPFDLTRNPTAENIAEHFYHLLSELFPDVKLDEVRVYESPDCCASYSK